MGIALGFLYTGKKIYNAFRNRKGVLAYEEFSNEVPFEEKPTFIEKGSNRRGLSKQISNKGNEKVYKAKEPQSKVTSKTSRGCLNRYKK